MKNLFVRVLLWVFILSLFFWHVGNQNIWVYAEDEEQEEFEEEQKELEEDEEIEQEDREEEENIEEEQEYEEEQEDSEENEENNEEESVEDENTEEENSQEEELSEETQEESNQENQNIDEENFEDDETQFDENSLEDNQEVDENDEEIKEVFQEENQAEEIEQEDRNEDENIEEKNSEDEEMNNDEEENDYQEKQEEQKEIQEEIEEQQEEIQELQEQLDESQQEVDELLEENEQLEEELIENIEENEEKEEIIEQFEEEKSQLIQEVKEAEQEIQELEEEIIQWEKNLDADTISKKIIKKYSDENPGIWWDSWDNIIEKPLENIVFIEAKLAQDEYFVELWQRIFFDSYNSRVWKNTKVYWNFWDGKFVKDKASASHLYKKAGVYTVTMKLVDGKIESQATASVYVSEKTFVLLTDSEISENKIEEIRQQAVQQNATLKIISTDYLGNNFELEEKMTKALLAEKNVLEKANWFISLSNSSSAINAYKRALKSENISTDNKQFIVLSDNKSEAKLIAKTHESTLWNYQNVIVTGLQATPEIFKSHPESIEKSLADKNIDFEKSEIKDVDFVHPGNFLSKIVDLLIEKNVAPNVVMLILMLPIAATVVVFFRQIVGLTSFGIFTPALLAVTFLATGLSYGLVMFFVILVAWVGLRSLIQNVKLLSVPRISLVMIFVSFIMILLLWLWAYLDHSFVYSIWAFPMLILAFVIEKFVTTQHEKWMKDAIILLLSTLLISIISYFVMNWQFLQTLLMAYAEIIFLLVIINIVLGKYTGMRVLEYMRFKVLINKLEK